VSPKRVAPTLVRTEAVMGTVVTIQVSDQGAEAAIERAFGWFHEIEDRCTRFQEGSMVVGSGNPEAPVATPKPKLLQQVRDAIRRKHFSPRTEESYVHWIKRFIFFHNKRHPTEMAEKEIEQFLSSLASELHVSASMQNQALNAILFLYRDVLRKEIGYVDGVIRAKRPHRLPVVLTRQEVKSILVALDHSDWLMVTALRNRAWLNAVNC